MCHHSVSYFSRSQVKAVLTRTSHSRPLALFLFKVVVAVEDDSLHRLEETLPA